MNYKRLLLSQLNFEATYLILGPRQTGKSTIIKNLKLTSYIDLLLSKTFLKYNRDPDLLYREVQALKKKKGIIAIDEIQKVPALLDVVHKLIEEYPDLHFVLSGSSARKLRHGSTNLLGGRAIDLRLHPLSYFELGKDYSLELALQFGTLPKIYSLAHQGKTAHANRLLSSYVTTYLEEEVRKEALVRKLDNFQRFLEVAGTSFAQQINFSEVAAHASLSDTTVKDYFEILEDTLIGNLLYPYHTSVRERLSKTPKFYLFDTGVVRAIQGLSIAPISNQERGRLFEQHVVQEVRRINDYYNLGYKLYFWRTAGGSEIDLLLIRGNQVKFAIECKSAAAVTRHDLSGLVSVRSDFSKAERILCAPVDTDRKEPDGIFVLRPESTFERVRG